MKTTDCEVGISNRLRQRGHRLLKPQPVDRRIRRLKRLGPEVAHVDAGTEPATRAREHDHVHSRISTDRGEGLRELVTHLLVDRVELSGPVQLQDNDTGPRPVDGEGLGHRTQRRGKPSTWVAMMLRWISDVPPAIVPPKLRAYRSNQLTK